MKKETTGMEIYCAPAIKDTVLELRKVLCQSEGSNIYADYNKDQTNADQIIVTTGTW